MIFRLKKTTYNPRARCADCEHVSHTARCANTSRNVFKASQNAERKNINNHEPTNALKKKNNKL